ncbi:MAG: DUF359 domain-containing protein [Euryarchaeota archaeon TMED248]|nr:MAG: DUF359 domain-containing protein [Euryarchaeota archaeon TMED248]
MNSKSKCLTPLFMDTSKRYNCCLVGGTFDRFHSGHNLLLNAAFRDSARVEVHVTVDSIASHKSLFVESYEERVENIFNWASKNQQKSIKVFPLNDSFGPAPEHMTADCIVATEETRGSCDQINDMRIGNGLEPLDIIIVPHIIDSYGEVLSSSRIRSGFVDTDGNPWLSDLFRGRIVKMAPVLDKELKTPMGQIFQGPEDMPEVAMSSALESLPEHRACIVAVGDVTVKTLLDMEIIPDIGLIDGMTKRTSLAKEDLVDISLFDEVLQAENPAGCLTPSLVESLEKAIFMQDAVIINVDGEEDLAPLYIHCLAPIGTVVLYGQPNQGVVSQITTLAVKKRCRELLSMFEVI